MRRLIFSLAAICLVVGLFAWWMAYDTTSSAAADNGAITDARATAQVKDEVSRALTLVLSYDHANPEPTNQAAEALLVDDARTEYDTLRAGLEKKAPGQKLVLSATVSAIAVKELQDDEAKLLVFIDQSSQRASDKDKSVSAAQLAISAERIDDAWRITELKPL